jgi:hypothetical protein
MKNATFFSSIVTLKYIKIINRNALYRTCKSPFATRKSKGHRATAGHLAYICFLIKSFTSAAIVSSCWSFSFFMSLTMSSGGLDGENIWSQMNIGNKPT